MKVRDLIVLLQACDPDDLVVLSKDGEGNSFSPLSRTSLDMFDGDDGILLRELTPELEADGEDEYGVGSLEEGDVHCITLWPN